MNYRTELCNLTLLFIIPRIVLLSSIQPEAEILEKSFENLPTNKGSTVKQSGNYVEGCRSEKVMVQPNMRVFLQYSVEAFQVLCCKSFRPLHSHPSKKLVNEILKCLKTFFQPCNPSSYHRIVEINVTFMMAVHETG